MSDIGIVRDYPHTLGLPAVLDDLDATARRTQPAPLRVTRHDPVRPANHL